MEKQVPLDRRGIDKRRPAAPADLVTLVDTISGELDTVPTVPLDRAAVQPTADRDDTELAGPLPGELDEARFNKVDGIAGPPAPLHDPPPTNQRHHCPENTSCHEASG